MNQEPKDYSRETRGFIYIYDMNAPRPKRRRPDRGAYFCPPARSQPTQAYVERWAHGPSPAISEALIAEDRRREADGTNEAWRDRVRKGAMIDGGCFPIPVSNVIEDDPEQVGTFNQDVFIMWPGNA